MIKTAEIREAADILRSGGLVALPTETVYGLGADAANEAAIRRIFKAKGRPFDHPLIVHIGKISDLSQWVLEVPENAERLAKAFWPGPLTLILKKQPHVLNIVTGGQDTVGIRMPNHPLALALLQTFGGGVVAPSANQFTHVSPTTAAAVREELGDKVDFILDGGACAVGLESTIIDLTHEVPVILRPGMITQAMLEDVLGMSVRNTRQDASDVRAPGMHHLHYAPMTKTVLMANADLANYLKAVKKPAVVVSHNDVKVPAEVQFVKMPNSAKAYAHDLYHTLRELDRQSFQEIIIESVPDTAEWIAIKDRLMKASGSSNRSP